MYAVIQTGGKQYRVQPGDFVQVEKLPDEVGASVRFEQVLFLSKGNPEAAQVWIGKPLVSGAKVEAEVVDQGRGEKVLIVKMKRRKQYRRTKGHRQELTQLLVTSVDNGAGERVALSDADKKTKLSTFQPALTPRGLPMTPKTLGSRKRLAAAARAAAPGEAGVGSATRSKAEASAEGTTKTAKKTTTKKTKKA